MKALKYIAGICLALSLTSCDDFLTKTSPDELTSGNYWRNKAMLNQVWLPFTHRCISVMSIASLR